MTSQKQCPKCLETKEESKFYLTHPWCKVCVKLSSRQSKSLRAQILWKKYKLTSEEYITLLQAQDYRCAICQEIFLETPHVDHNHLTGQVRGLLCLRHNAGLGYFKDSPEELQKGIEYLQKTPLLPAPPIHEGPKMRNAGFQEQIRQILQMYPNESQNSRARKLQVASGEKLEKCRSALRRFKP